MVLGPDFGYGGHVSKNGPQKVTFEIKNTLKFAAGGLPGGLLRQTEKGWTRKD